MPSSSEDRRLVPSMRVLLRVAALLVFLAGLQLFVFPLRTADWFAWTVAPPMTAVFLGAAYWSSAVLELAGARAAGWERARMAVWPVFVFTTLTLGVTLLHLDRFHLAAGHPLSARVVTWGWLAIYAGVPIAMLLARGLQARMEDRSSGSWTAVGAGLPRVLRMLLAGLAVVLLGVGLALLAVPVRAVELWPWPLTALTGRAVGAWLVGLGWAAAQARWRGDADTVRPLGLTAVTFVGLQVVALLRHGDDLAWPGAPAVGYLVVLAAIGVAGGWMLALGRR